MRAATLALIATLATPALAQQRDSVFTDYAAYDAFVDAAIKERDFERLIVNLGGRDEFTAEQLANLRTQFLAIYLDDFEEKTVFKKIDLGGGVSQEGRMYWTGESYVFYYAILHQRTDDLVVINFSLNSNVNAILSKF